MAPLATALIVVAASAAARDFPVRMPDPAMRVAVVRAAVHSPTLHRLVAGLRARRAIVYVKWSPVLPARVRGAVMPRVTDTGGVRYLWVALKPDKVTTATVALIAHEIQHTIEILDAGLTDSAAIGAMYERLEVGEGGTKNRIHDTAAAQAVGQQVEQELNTNGALPSYEVPLF